MKIGATPQSKFQDPTFQRLQQAIPDGIFIVSEDGRILTANEHSEQMFGYKQQELQGKSIETLIPSRYRHVLVAYRASYGADSNTRPMGACLQLTGLRKDKTELPIIINLSPIETENGVLVVCSVCDITHRLQREEEFRISYQQQQTLNHLLQVSLGQASLTELLERGTS